MRTARFLRFSAVVCMTAMFLSAVAEAQPPQGGRGEGGGRQRGGQQGGRGGQQRGGFGQQLGPGGGAPSVSKAHLLGVEDVKDELDIDEVQQTTIAAALEIYRQERDDARPERGQFDRSQFENATDEERQALRDKMEKERDELNKKRDALNKKTDQMLATLLEPEQVKRLGQIAFQVRIRFGLIAVLKSDEMRDKLSITDEQIAKFDKVEEDASAARRKMFEGLRSGGGGERPDFSKIGEMMAESRKETEKNVLAVVTDEQNAILASMKGEAFEFDMRALQRGGGRGGFGGGDRSRGRGEGGGDRRRPAADSDDAI
ncbi:MAG: hypothetical protein P8J37_18235 [Fuerstiella sp.]|nr:hypothetical protein [Fuerstiella sp.]